MTRTTWHCVLAFTTTFLFALSWIFPLAAGLTKDKDIVAVVMPSKNVVGPCSERINSNAHESKPFGCKLLKNRVKFEIFRTDHKV